MYISIVDNNYNTKFSRPFRSFKESIQYVTSQAVEPIINFLATIDQLVIA